MLLEPVEHARPALFRGLFMESRTEMGMETAWGIGVFTEAGSSARGSKCCLELRCRGERVSRIPTCVKAKNRSLKGDFMSRALFGVDENR